MKVYFNARSFLLRNMCLNTWLDIFYVPIYFKIDLVFENVFIEVDSLIVLCADIVKKEINKFFTKKEFKVTE